MDTKPCTSFSSPHQSKSIDGEASYTSTNEKRGPTPRRSARDGAAVAGHQESRRSVRRNMVVGPQVQTTLGQDARRLAVTANAGVGTGHEQPEQQFPGYCCWPVVSWQLQWLNRLAMQTCPKQRPTPRNCSISGREVIPKLGIDCSTTAVTG